MKQSISCQLYALLGSATMTAIVLLLTQVAYVLVTGKAHNADKVYIYNMYYTSDVLEHKW